MAKGRYRFVWDREIIQKIFAWYNGALIDTIGTIVPVGVLLEDTMPMLRRHQYSKIHPKKERSYDRSHPVQGSVLKFIADANSKSVALRIFEIERQQKKCQWIPPCLP